MVFNYTPVFAMEQEDSVETEAVDANEGAINLVVKSESGLNILKPGDIIEIQIELDSFELSGYLDVEYEVCINGQLVESEPVFEETSNIFLGSYEVGTDFEAYDNEIVKVSVDVICNEETISIENAEYVFYELLCEDIFSDICLEGCDGIICEGDTIKFSFNASHPVIVENAYIGELEVGMESPDGMLWYGELPVEGQFRDMEELGFKAFVYDEAEQSAVLISAEEKLVFYKPLKLIDGYISTHYPGIAKAGDYIEVGFRTNHPCVVDETVLNVGTYHFESIDGFIVFTFAVNENADNGVLAFDVSLKDDAGQQLMISQDDFSMVVIDTIAPKVDFSVSPYEGTVESIYDTDIFYNGPVKIESSFYDKNLSVGHMFLNDQIFTDFDGKARTILLSEDGIYRVSFEALDMAGNYLFLKDAAVFNIDTTAPKISFEIDLFSDNFGGYKTVKDLFAVDEAYKNIIVRLDKYGETIVAGADDILDMSDVKSIFAVAVDLAGNMSEPLIAERPVKETLYNERSDNVISQNMLDEFLGESSGVGKPQIIAVNHDNDEITPESIKLRKVKDAVNALPREANAEDAMIIVLATILIAGGIAAAIVFAVLRKTK